MANKKKRKPFIFRDTIWKSVGGGLSNPGQTKVCKVGKHKILLTRANKLDKYGNPVHTATYINKDGTPGISVKSNGSATLCVSNLLKRKGIETKYKKPNKKMKKANNYVNSLFPSRW